MTQSYLSDSLHILEEKTSAYTQEKDLLQMRHLILRVTSRCLADLSQAKPTSWH